MLLEVSRDLRGHVDLEGESFGSHAMLSRKGAVWVTLHDNPLEQRPIGVATASFLDTRWIGGQTPGGYLRGRPARSEVRAARQGDRRREISWILSLEGYGGLARK